jgi:hypothetical protein
MMGGLGLFPPDKQPLSFAKRQLAVIALMLDEEETNAALGHKKKWMWVNSCKNTGNLFANRE